MSLKKYLEHVKFMEEAKARVGLANFELPKLIAIIEAQAEALEYGRHRMHPVEGLNHPHGYIRSYKFRKVVDDAIAKAEKIAAGERV